MGRSVGRSVGSVQKSLRRSVERSAGRRVGRNGGGRGRGGGLNWRLPGSFYDARKFVQIRVAFACISDLPLRKRQELNEQINHDLKCIIASLSTKVPKEFLSVSNSDSDNSTHWA